METRTVTWFLMMAILGSGRTQDSACMNNTLKMNGSSGNIISPLNYSATVIISRIIKCRYWITVGTGKMVLLYISNYTKYRGAYGNVYVFSATKPQWSNRITTLNELKDLTVPLQSKGPNMFLLYSERDDAHAPPGLKFNLTWYAIDDPCSSSNKPSKQSGDSGWILSSQSSLSDYDNNADCCWTVSVDDGSLIRLDFRKFILQDPAPNGTCSDEVIVYDGGSNLSEAITHNFCGSVDRHTITSSYSSLHIVLKSDSARTAKGFQVSWFKMSKPVCSPSNTPEQITGPSGYIRSLNFPHNYISTLDCGWAITAAKGMQIKLHFHTFEVSYNDSADDYVAIYDDINQTVDLSGTLYANNQPPECVESFDNTIYIVFKTNSMVTNKGFNLSWTANKSACSSSPLTLISSTPGTTYHFASHNYPYLYANDLNCRWVISTTAPQVIQITFNSFTLEDRDSDNSCKDMIRAYDGDERNDSNALTEEICGSRLPDHITSTTDKLLLVFTTDDRERKPGFQLSWSSFFPCVPGKTTAVTGTRGKILSRNYPNDYDRNIVCSWRINTTEAWEVQLSYNDFDVKRYENGTCQDKLIAYNGVSANQSNLIDDQAICGSQSPKDTISSTHEVFLQFISGSMNTGTGFNISWKRTGNYPCHPDARPVLITGENGTVKSPNYPANYGNNMDCQWKISGPTGSKINLHVDDIWLEHFDHEGMPFYCVDKLWVYDGGSPSRLLYNDPLCAASRKRNLTSTKSEVYLVFTTSNFATRRGFKLSWKAVS